MRMLHTSDWHLGRLFFRYASDRRSAHVLDQLIALAVDYKAHVVLVSGDVFDRAVPPVEAVDCSTMCCAGWCWITESR
jgi:exonuclease SbcD